MLEGIFYSSLLVIVFTYVLYGPVMVLLRKLKKNEAYNSEIKYKKPSISLVIPAFNEEGWIQRKIQNSLDLNYPSNKLEIIVVTDGSNDNTYKVASEFGDKVTVIHDEARNGKIKAMDRAANIAKNKILVFTDANTDLNTDCLTYIAQNFQQTDVGMVSGEKKVLAKEEGESASGEGLYWKYESWLKTLDSDVASVIGAAGELFAIRKELYEILPPDTLLDDFMLSTRVIEKGYRVVYEPNAVAKEFGSVSYSEEWKRKVRICAGGVQSIIRSKALFNFSKFGLKSFSFLVHRASRWTLAPLALILAYVTSAVLMTQSVFYLTFFILGSFSLLITRIAIAKNLNKLPKPLLLIVYFTFMHLSAIAGWIRYARKSQSVNWERSARL